MVDFGKSWFQIQCPISDKCYSINSIQRVDYYYCIITIMLLSLKSVYMVIKVKTSTCT